MKTTVNQFIAQFFWFSTLLFGLLAVEATAQKNNNKYRQFPALGFEFKPLKNFSDVPVSKAFKSRGIVGQFKAEHGPTVKFGDGDRHEYPPTLKVIYQKPEGPTTGGGRESERKVDERKEAKDFVLALYSSAIRGSDFDVDVSEFKATKKRLGERAQMVASVRTNFDDIDITFDVYTFVLDHAKVVFVWEYPAEEKVRKKWSKPVAKSMQSFRLMKKGAVGGDLGDVTSESSYEDLLEYHRDEVAQTPGWRVVETRSKQYLIKTNSEKDKNIKDVVARLEASRKLYEEDFPPPKPITSISVVRLCATEGDFHTYGGTGGGVAGWFNPRSEELVLFFGESGKASTLSVMAHEGFHQYCHFLFDRAEAHRWFDEGHGDYYGAWKMKGKKLIPDDDMQGGLARIPEIKQMFRNNTIKPLSEHIRYDHSSWQSQGPSNVSCYAQSFSLIYYLREGGRGKVKRKYWMKEYATIIPNYMDALNKGFQASYEKVREEGQKVLDELADLDPDDVDPKVKEGAEDRVNKPWNFARSDKEEIWSAAMEASWGSIDEAELERRWLDYIDNVL